MCIVPTDRVSGAIGNRRAQSLTYLLLALLTHRVLVLHHQALGAQVAGFEHSKYFALPDRITPQHQADLKVVLRAALATQPAASRRIDLATLCCTDIADWLSNSSVVQVAHDPNQSTLGFQFVEANSRYSEFVSRHFGRYFGYIGALYFLRPGAQVEAAVERFKRSHFSGFFMIGIHIRWGRGRDDIYFDLWESLQQFWECALSLAWGIPSARFFVATDSKAVLAEATRALGKQRVVALQMSDRAPEMAWSAAMTDLQLLADCDALVGTGNSSYSVAAHQSGLTQPHIIRSCGSGCQRATHSQLLGVGEPLAHHTLEESCISDNEHSPDHMRIRLKYFT